MTGQVKYGYYLWQHPDGLSSPVEVEDAWVKGGIVNMPLYMVEGTLTPLVAMTPEKMDALGDVVSTLEAVRDAGLLKVMPPARLGVIERRLEVLHNMLLEARGEVGDGQS